MPFAIIPSEEISHRIDFPLLCNARGYKDAVEVGTDLGIFAKQFLSRFDGHWLWCVDPYASYDEFPHDRTPDMLTAMQALSPWHGRFRFVRAPSVEAAKWVPKHIRPEFVYIDGDHSFNSVIADLIAWWEIIPDTGCIAGHDHDDDHPEVVAAVRQFARERRLVVRLTQEPVHPPSFYMYKQEPDVLFRRHFDQGESPNLYARGG